LDKHLVLHRIRQAESLNRAKQ